MGKEHDAKKNKSTQDVMFQNQVTSSCTRDPHLPMKEERKEGENKINLTRNCYIHPLTAPP